MANDPDGARLDDATEERPAGARRYALVMWALVVVGVLAPLLFALVSRRSPVPFVVTFIVQLVILGYVVRCARYWLRSGRQAGRGDYLLAVVPGVGAVLAFAMVSVVAEDVGIAGSALPRVLNGVRNGVPLVTDLGYLGSMAATVVVALSAVGLIVVFARHRVRSGLEDVGRGAASAAKAVGGKPRQDRGLVPATHVSDGFWRRLVSPSVWVVFVLSAVAAVPAFWMLAADPGGDLGLIGFLFVFPGVLVGGWAALQTTWRPDEQLGYMLAALTRGVLVPAVTVPPLAVVHVVLTRLPVLRERVVEHQRPDAYIRHYWFSGESGAINIIDGSLAGTFFMSVLGGFAFALIAAILMAVFVVWPVNAVRNPTGLFRDSMLSKDPAAVANNVAVVRATSVLMMLAFVVPTCMVLADSDEVLWWVGAALIPALVGLTYFVWSRQRVDHRMRAKWGMAAAIPNPADPPPPDLDQT